MKLVVAKLREFLRAEGGATAIEYALIAGCISIAILLGVTGIGTKLNSTFTSVQTGLP